MERHDRNEVHVSAFSGVAAPDLYTEQFKSCEDDWIDVANASDEQFCEEVRKRFIDILIDCGGRTSRTRLSSFALRPAPIQISWPG